MKISYLLTIILPFVVGCVQPLTPEEFVRQRQLSFSENSTYRFDFLIDSMANNRDAFGEKFFLIFLQNACSFCKELYPAIQELKENTTKYFDESVYGEFLFYSFYREDETEAYENWLTSPDASYDDFIKQLQRIPLVGENTFDFYDIPTPTLMFYDVRGLEKGVKVIWRGVPGSTTQEKVNKLVNLWTYENIENILNYL